MIEVENIYKSYGSKSVLKGLSFDAPAGKITGLIGKNGSGKSTTIRILTGFIEADSGSIRVNNNSISVNSFKAKHSIGYAAESAPSYREDTVKEYLTFIAKLRGVTKSELSDEVDRCMSAFALSRVATQAIGTLSKGYRHRTSLAQCLLGDPPAIVLDEPTDGLDPVQKIEAREMIRELSKSKAVLLTTHLLEEVDTLCDKVVVINGGNVVFSGTTEEAKLENLHKIDIHIRLAPCDSGYAKEILSSIEGFTLEKFNIEKDRIYSMLSFHSKNDHLLLLNIVSQSIHYAGLRVIELRHESASLKNIFL